MSIKNNYKGGYYTRKADQCYDMAGLARQDGDTVDAERQLKKAKEFDQLAREAGEK